MGWLIPSSGFTLIATLHRYLYLSTGLKVFWVNGYNLDMEIFTALLTKGYFQGKNLLFPVCKSSFENLRQNLSGVGWVGV